MPTVNLTQGTPHVFRTAHLPEAVDDQNIAITDLLVAATAAPTYFPHKEIKEQAFADGGLWASDPSMLAYAEAMRIRTECRRGVCDVKFAPEDIHLLSVGTGISQYSLTPPGGNAGIMYWVRHAADVMSSAQTQGIHQPLRFMLRDNYVHLNFKMKTRWPLDGVENIPQLFELGKKRAAEEFDLLNCHFFGHERAQFEPYEASESAPEVHREFRAADT